MKNYRVAARSTFHALTLSFCLCILCLYCLRVLAISRALSCFSLIMFSKPLWWCSRLLILVWRSFTACSCISFFISSWCSRSLSESVSPWIEENLSSLSFKTAALFSNRASLSCRETSSVSCSATYSVHVVYTCMKFEYTCTCMITHVHT